MICSLSLFLSDLLWVKFNFLSIVFFLCVEIEKQEKNFKLFSAIEKCLCCVWIAQKVAVTISIFSSLTRHIRHNGRCWLLCVLHTIIRCKKRKRKNKKKRYNRCTHSHTRLKTIDERLLFYRLCKRLKTILARTSNVRWIYCNTKQIFVCRLLIELVYIFVVVELLF